MSSNLIKVQELKHRFERVLPILIEEWLEFDRPNNYDQAVADMEDIILDFKTLLYQNEPDSPLYEEVRKFPYYRERGINVETEKYMARFSYLLDKYIQYNSEE